MPDSARYPGETPRVLEQENQLSFVFRCRFKAETPVERVCLGVEGVGQHCADACVLGNGDGAPDGILQQAEAQSPLLVVEINGQPCKDDQRDRVLTHPATNPLRSLECVDLADGQAVVACNTLTITRHEGSCRPAALGLARVAQQPFRERRFSTAELFQSMTCIQRLRCRQTHFVAQTGRRENRSAKPGLSDSGRSSISNSAWY